MRDKEISQIEPCTQEHDICYPELLFNVPLIGYSTYDVTHLLRRGRSK